jgi:hypothetical protein
MRAKIATLEGANGEAAHNPFSGIGISVPVVTSAGRGVAAPVGSFVLQSNFEATKQSLEDGLAAVNAMVNNVGSVGALDLKVENAIQ